jgi:hypothetical protein
VALALLDKIQAQERANGVHPRNIETTTLSLYLPACLCGLNLFSWTTGGGGVSMADIVLCCYMSLGSNEGIVCPFDAAWRDGTLRWGSEQARARRFGWLTRGDTRHNSIRPVLDMYVW